jgi:glycosyltransferase involved in cell wall biosynthesis
VAPRVSVIVPCHDLGRYLEEAVDSVLAQSFQDLEILILDDGSTDAETLALLESFDRPRTAVYRSANRGLAAARNFLLARARGEFVCALDADDRLRPGFLDRTVATLASDPSLGFVSTRLQMFGDQESVWPTLERCDLAALLSEDTVITAALTRRQLLLDLGGYDEGMPAPGDEDWDLWIRIVKAGHPGVILPEILFDYRRRPGSMSADCTSPETHLELFAYLVDKHRHAYSSCWCEVLGHRERIVGELRTSNVALEHEIATALSPALESRRRELARLEALLGEHLPGGSARRAAPPAPTGGGPSELFALRAEVDALRRSWSWRVTAPLRALHRLLHRLGPGAP